jgi:hypothetical protein
MSHGPFDQAAEALCTNHDVKRANITLDDQSGWAGDETRRQLKRISTSRDRQR